MINTFQKNLENKNAKKEKIEKSKKNKKSKITFKSKTPLKNN